MTIILTKLDPMHTDFSPRVTVIGVGGGGTNAVDNMIAANLQGVEFVVANTDAQQLMHSRTERRIQLGPHITQGLGAGAKPEIGQAAAEEAADELYRHLDGSHMVFITAGMGGGTGTGAAPVIARMARERNILTVGVVTKPFDFEGRRRARAAEEGIEKLQQQVDTLIVIPNQNLFRIANERTTWNEAFKLADQVLYMGVRGVTDLMMAPGKINLDFADIRTVMQEMGKAMMGTGEAEGEDRARRAAEEAINNPLLEDTSMGGARGLLINITGGEDMTLFEVEHAAKRVAEEVDPDARILFGSAIDPSLNGRIRVSVIATGIDRVMDMEQERPKLVAVGGGAAMAVGSARGTGGATPDAAAHPTPHLHLQPVTSEAPSSPGINLRPSAPTPAYADAPEAVADSAPRGFAPSGFVPSGARPRPVPVAAPHAAESSPAEHGKPSLFGNMTGLWRRRAHGGIAAPPAEPAPARHEPELSPRVMEDPPRASVRPLAGEEMGLEIPTFLRRQHS